MRTSDKRSVYLCQRKSYIYFSKFEFPLYINLKNFCRDQTVKRKENEGDQIDNVSQFFTYQ